MKPKISIPARGKSNPPRGKNLPPSSLLEEETKKMEQKLKELKEIMALEQAKRAEAGIPQDGASGTRWRSANDKVPLKNYAKAVLESKKRPISNGTQVKNDKENVSNSQTIFSSTQSSSLKDDQASNNNKKGIVGQNDTMTKMGRQAIIATHSIDYQRKSDEDRPASSSSLAMQNNVTTYSNDMKLVRASENMVEKNLKKALNTQNKPMTFTDNFLSEIGLDQYKEVFKDNGFDDKEILVELTTKHLVDMKIPAGHQIKIMKNIDKLRQNSTTQESKGNDGNIVQVKKSMDSSTTPSDNQVIPMVNKENSTRKNRYGDDEDTNTTKQSLDESYYAKRIIKPSTADQKEPRTAGGLRNSRPDSKTKSVRFSDDTQDFEKRDASGIVKKSLTKSKSDGVDLFKSIKETGTTTDISDFEKIKTGKKSCWNCYGLFDEINGYKYNDRIYCTQNCFNNYKLLNSVQCANKTCKKEIMKRDSVIKQGLWYCNDKCAPSLEEILLEEQRTMAKLLKEGNMTMDNDENILDEFNFGKNIGKKPDIVTLEELENKYRLDNNNNGHSLSRPRTQKKSNNKDLNKVSNQKKIHDNVKTNDDELNDSLDSLN